MATGHTSLHVHGVREPNGLRPLHRLSFLLRRSSFSLQTRWPFARLAIVLAALGSGNATAGAQATPRSEPHSAHPVAYRQAAQTNHKEAAFDCVRAYVGAILSGDADGALKLCTAKPGLRPTIEAITRETVAKAMPANTNVALFYRAGDERRAVVRVKLTWTVDKSRTVLALDYRVDPEDGVWRIQGARDAYDHVQASLIGAEDEVERRDVIASNAELVDGTLGLQLRREAERLSLDGKHTDALKVADAALAVGKYMKSPYDLGYGYLTRGSIRKRMSDWNAALRDYEAARKHFVEAKDREGEGKTQSRAASVYSLVGLPDKAIQFYKNALEIAVEIRDEDAEANALQDIGAVLKDMARPAEALEWNAKARAIRARRGERGKEAVLIANEAGLHADLGRHGKAVAMFMTALATQRELKDHDGIGYALNNLANVLDELGNLEGARDRFMEARDAFRQSRNRSGEWMTLHNLAGVLLRLGDSDGALATGMAAAEIADAIDERRYRAQSDGLLQDILLELKRYQQVLDLTEDRLASARKSGNRVQEAAALTAAAFALVRLNRIPEARARLAEATPIAERTGSPAVLRQIWRCAGDAAAATRDWPGAASAYARAVEYIEQDRLQAQEHTLRTTFLRQHVFVYRSLIAALVESGRIGDAFAASERAKGRALADLLIGGRVDLDSTMAPDDRQRLADLQNGVRSAASRLQAAVLTDELEAARRDLERARKELEDFRIALYLRRPDIETRRAEFAPATLKAIGDSLLPASRRQGVRKPGTSPARPATRGGTAILSYAFTADRGFLFVVDRAPSGVVRLSHFTLNVRASDLVADSDLLWMSAASPGGAYERPAQTLYRRLLAPAEQLLSGKSHLIIVPDTAAPPVPYAAMLDLRGRPIIERWSLSYAPSVTALVRMVQASRTRAKRGAGLLAVGAPRFPAGFSPLPATAEEARRIAGLSRSGHALLGDAATRRQVEARGASARYLHFATHGVLDERAPMQSAIVLTPSDGDGGMLRARDLAEMNLSADLVTLSACETALGRHISGEGVIGLTWGLFAGGAASTLASQWQVYDESTRALMVEFYRLLLRPGAPAMSKAEALRRAQLAVRKMPRYRHPYYWAAFTLAGVP